jgi:hypothetical protein
MPCTAIRMKLRRPVAVRRLGHGVPSPIRIRGAPPRLFLAVFGRVPQDVGYRLRICDFPWLQIRETMSTARRDARARCSIGYTTMCERAL